MRKHRKYALWGAAFTSLLALGAVTAAITAGAAPFGAQATTTMRSPGTTNGTTCVTTITTTTPDSSSTGSTGSSASSTSSTSTDTTATDTTTTTDSGDSGNSAGGGTAPAATPADADPNFTG